MSRIWLGVLLLCSISASATTEHLYCHHCSVGQFAAAPDSSDYRRYARSREIDVEHLKLDITPDFATHTVSGTATIRFKPIGLPLQQVKLDGINLNVTSVTASAPLASHHNTGSKIVLQFRKPVKVGQSVTATIKYSAEPQKGLYFRTPKNGYPKSSQQIWTQGEPHEARHWFPVYDYPNEKFTSEIICHVPRGMTVLSNGRLAGTKPGANGLVARHWKQNQPHVAYLITLVAGYLEKIEDNYRDISLTFWTPPEDIHLAKNSFRYTKNMMDFFEKEIGVKYPWDQYGQVCVHGFMWGGMENTAMTTLTRRTLFDETTENIFASDGLVAHELAHQWFGDYVTCKDWSQLWLNEGFATYYDALWHGHYYGQDRLKFEMYGNARSVLNQKNEKKGIVFRGYEKATDQFSYLVYPKGAWVLHMLRSQLGADVYRKAVTKYLQRHKLGVVETADLKLVLEEVSGRSLDRFFDQWLNGIGTPKLSLTQSWNAENKLAKVTIRQTQKIDEKHPLFQFPLTLRFKNGRQSVDHVVEVTEKVHEFYVPLKWRPEIVRADPDYTLLATVDFKKPNAMLYAQLADGSDLMGRIFAAQQLGKKKDRLTVAQLKSALMNDKFYGVRAAAAAALRSVHTSEALGALIAARKQDNAHVRRAVCDAISGFYDPRANATLRAILKTEKNPAVVAAALPGIARWGAKDTDQVLLAASKVKNFRDTAVDGAINAMRVNGDPALAWPLQKLLQARATDLQARTFDKGLDAVAFLARNESNKGPVREFITGYARHRRTSTQVAAIKALGTLGDPQAIGVVEAFAGGAEGSPPQKAAKTALEKLRAGRPAATKLDDLRRELETLKRAQQAIQKQLEDAQKRDGARRNPAQL